MIVVREVDAERTFPLRFVVLRNSEEEPRLSLDSIEGAFHLAAYDGDDVAGVVGCAPLDRDDLPPGAWQLFAMAVVAERRGAGIGRVLVSELVARVRERGGSAVWANARIEAVGFYETLGFRVDPAPFPGWRGIVHHVVVLETH